MSNSMFREYVTNGHYLNTMTCFFAAVLYYVVASLIPKSKTLKILKLLSWYVVKIKSITRK